MILRPNGDFKLMRYVDSDFGGCLDLKILKIQVCAHSMGLKTSTEIARTTIEAEYIALSQAMRDLIPIRETVKEIYYKVFKKQLTPTCTAQSTIF